jgi:hypothetical protein
MPWRQRLAILAMAAYLAYLLFPSVAGVIGAGVGFALPLLYLLAFVLIIVVVPLAAFWLFGFAYSVMAKPYVRAWRINRIRNARYLKEAMERGDREEQDVGPPE